MPEFGPWPAPDGDYHVIVIGAGHNGLICACYLAKAGRKVLVLEKRHVLGGAEPAALATSTSALK